MKLTPAQIAALRKFAQPGGYVFGGSSPIGSRTARVLERHGLIIVVDVREHVLPVGLALPRGTAVLRSLDGA